VAEIPIGLLDVFFIVELDFGWDLNTTMPSELKKTGLWNLMLYRLEGH